MSLFDENNIISRFILSAINGRKKHGEHIHFKVGEIDAIQNIMHVIISEIYSNNHLKRYASISGGTVDDRTALECASQRLPYQRQLQ